MTVNLKRGLLEGTVVAVICTGLVVVLFWRIRSENPFTASDFNNLGLVTFSTGLLGFLIGAFRPPPFKPKK
jgi:hypothetical protein